MIHQIQVLGTILRSFGRAVCTFYYPVSFPAPETNILTAAVFVDEKEAKSSIVMWNCSWIKLLLDNVLTKTGLLIFEWKEIYPKTPSICKFWENVNGERKDILAQKGEKYSH